MRINLVGAFHRNHPFGTEIAFLKGFQRLQRHIVSIIDPTRPNQLYDYKADVTVVFKCLDDWTEVDKCSGRKVVYQPDDLRYPHIKDLMEEARRHCEYALTYDEEAVRVCYNELKFRDAERLLLTADDELYTPRKLKKDFDFCFVGNMSHPQNHKSRRQMVDLLLDAGYKVVYADALYNVDKIIELYNRSKVVINHATDVGQPFGTGYGYQCRHFEAGMTKACLLSNSVIDDDCALVGWLAYHDEDELLELAQVLMDNETLRERYSEVLYTEIKKKHLPQHRAEQMINFFKRIGA